MKSKNAALSLAITLLLLESASATIVVLSANSTDITVGDSVKFHVEIYPDKPVGGILSLNQEIGPKHYKLVHIFFSRSSCTSCGTYSPLTEDYIRDYAYEFNVQGTYYVIADFGNATEKVDFTVNPPATTTTATTTTSSTTATTTTVTTTESITMTSDKKTTTTENIPEKRENDENASDSYFWLLVPLIFIVFVFFVFLFRKEGQKERGGWTR